MESTRHDQDLATALSALHREVGALYGVVSRQFGLTTQQAQLLCSLAHRRPSLGELAALLGCDKTNVTGMVDRLERRQFLRREADQEDRRVSRVTLTEQGAAIGVALRAAFANAVAERCGSVPPSDRRQLAQLTLAAVDALNASR